MKFKPNVRLKDLTPQMALAAIVVYHLYQSKGIECVITSANDSVHGERSLHYKGNALDFRTKNYPGDKRWLKEEIAANLGQDFDVVYEDPDGDNQHIHVEYQPR